MFRTKRSLYQKLFNKNSETINRVDEIVVYPNQSNNDPSTSQHHDNDAFQEVQNVLNFFESNTCMLLLKNSNKVLILKFKTLRKPTRDDLEILSQKCLENSIIILLIDEIEKFHLYWKSNQIRHFLTLSIYERADFLNDAKFFKFLTTFLSNSINHGHLGLHSKIPKNSVRKLKLHLLANHRNFNLLLIAADVGDVYVVKLLLTLGFSTEHNEVNAQTLAWKNRHFEVLSILLKSNLTYPYSIYIDECPDDIKEFYEISKELNDAILSKNESKVLSILSQNTDMIHFYNLNNESALAFALNHRLFDMYRLLISKNIMLGPHERFSEIKEDMKETEREKLREIHYKESKILPDNHMHVLLSNSRLGHDSSDVQKKFKIIQNAFEILNGNPFVQIILRTVAASRNFHIIFDFNRESVEVVDPTVDDSTDGLFYLSGRIYIAAKKLLDEDKKFDALGVLAHELCHFALSLVYKNSAKPYNIKDSKTKKTFRDIIDFCTDNAGKERIIDVVQEGYQPPAYHAEIIVRVPHLIMKYLKEPEKLNAVRSTFHKLFEIYEDKIYKEMKKALPRIEAKAETEKEKNKKKIKIRNRMLIVAGILIIIASVVIFLTFTTLYKPTYKFSKLDPKDQLKVENAPVVYNHVNIFFHDLFPRNSSAYNLLTSDDISQMLDKIPLDFSNPHLYYLNKLIYFEWANLTTKLKDKFLATNFTFQNESLTFEIMNITTQEVFRSLQSKQIIDVLEGKPFVVHKMIANETAFYTERRMFTEYIYIIYFLYMNKLNGDKTQFDCVYKNMSGTSNDTFKSFYQTFINGNFITIISVTNQIINSDYYTACSVSDFKILDPKAKNVIDSLLHHKSFQKSFDKVLIEGGIIPNVNSSRIFILSADAGTGKTETFRQFALRIKRIFPTRWVSYINYRENKDYYGGKFDTIKDAKEALVKILKLNPDNKFESKTFEEFFVSGRMIILWDGFDQIYRDLSDNSSTGALKILDLIHSHTQNVQFISTRPSHSDKLRTYFQIEPYTFVPLNKVSKKAFLRGYFISQNKTESEISMYIEKVQKIVNSINSKNDFNTPLPLGMIAYIISDDKEIFKSENLYQIYQKFVETKLLMWLNNINGEKKLITALLMNGISVSEIYQKYALRVVPDNKIRSFNRFLSLKLKITTEKFPKNIKINQISEMGILFINSKKSYSFAHSSFVEYFIAQYIIENIFKTKNDVYEQEAELRIQMFFWAIQESRISIFIESYLKTLATDSLTTFNPQILELLLTKYSNFMINILQGYTTPIPLLMEFFKKNHTLLNRQLKVNTSDSIYASTFDFAHFNINSYGTINRSDILNIANQTLTTDEYNRFVSLNNHKGVILYSMYCVKQFHNSSDYARQFTPGYDLSDEIFNNYNVSEVLTSIVEDLTLEESKNLLTSKTVWYRLYIFNGTSINIVDNDYEFFTTLLKLIEANLNITEQKKWILNNLKFPFLIKDEKTRNFLKAKIKNLTKKSDIFDRFVNTNILHFTATIGNTESSSFFERFEYSWNFFVANSNTEQQKQILKTLSNAECYMNHKFTTLCYLLPKIYLLQASLIENLECNGCNSSRSFLEMVQIYKRYFSKTELQDLIITGSKDFIAFLIIVRYSEDCNAYAEFLKELFKGNEASLKKFLSEPVEPTVLGVLDLFSSLYYAQENFQIFERLRKHLEITV